MLALLVATASQTSYGKSRAGGITRNCAANWADLAHHPEAGGSCNPSGLKNLISRLSGVSWTSSVGTLELEQPGPSENFYLIFNGAKKYGKICCTEGLWAIAGYGAISFDSNSISISGITFRRPQHSFQNTPARFADFSGGLDNGG